MPLGTEFAEAQRAAYLVYLGYFVFGYVFPLVVFLRMRRSQRIRQKYRNSKALALRVIYLSWFIQLAFRLWTNPLVSRYREMVLNAQVTDGDYRMVDGVGGNCAYLVFGWLPPMLTLALLCCVERIRALWARS